MYDYGRSGIQLNGKIAKRYYVQAVWWEYCGAVLSLGGLLHDGLFRLVNVPEKPCDKVETRVEEYGRKQILRQKLQ